MPEIVIQADLGGISIAITEQSPPDIDAQNDILDRVWKVIGRQKARLELSEKILARAACEKMLALLPEQELSMVKGRIEDRARLVLSWEQQYAASGKRGDFRPNDSHRKALESFDAQTESEREKFRKQKASLETDGPMIEAQISRLRAIIAGRDPTEYVPEDAKEGAAKAA